MPYKKKYNKKNRVVKYRRSRISSQPVPMQQTVRLNYDEYFELDPGAIAVADKRVFSINSLFDPDRSTAGFQPYGFDQWSAFYDKYTVIGAKIKVTFTREGSTDEVDVYPQVCCIAAMQSSTGLADIRRYTSSTRNVSGVIQADTSGKLVKTLKINPNRFLGVKNPIGEDSVTAAITANPSQECFFHVACAPVSGTLNAGILRCYAEIEYTAVFSQPKMLNLS